jgi:hypothetical protein
MLKNKKIFKIGAVLLILVAFAGFSLSSVSATTPTYHWKLVKGDKVVLGDWYGLSIKTTHKLNYFKTKFFNKQEDVWTVFRLLASNGFVKVFKHPSKPGLVGDEYTKYTVNGKKRIVVLHTTNAIYVCNINC